MALNVIMLGAPGAGKGTQAARFARAKGLARIATGEILREAVAMGTPLGLQADDLVRRLGLRQVCEQCGTNVDEKNPAKAAACGRCGGRLIQRADDNPETVRERLKVYERQTRPLVEFYQVRPTFKAVNGA